MRRHWQRVTQVLLHQEVRLGDECRRDEDDVDIDTLRVLATTLTRATNDSDDRGGAVRGLELTVRLKLG